MAAEVEGTIIVLSGIDAQRIEQTLAGYRAQFLAKYEETDIELVDGRELAAASELQALVETRAFFGGKRLVIVRQLSENRSPRLRADVAGLLDRFRASPTVLIFVETRTLEQKKLEKADPLLRALRSEKHSQVFVQPSPAELMQRIGGTLARGGVKVLPEAARQLAADIGDELGRLPQELEKLRAFKEGSATPLTAEDVRSLVRPQLHANVFALTDALGARDAVSLVRTLEELYAVGEAGPRLHAMLTTNVRNLLLARDALDRGKSQKEAIAVLVQKPFPGLHPFPAEKTVRQAAKTPRADLNALFHALRRFDVDAKTGNAPDFDAGLMQTLVGQILPPKTARA